MKRTFACVTLALLLCCSSAALTDGLAIPDAKRLANDLPVTLTAKTITYAAPDFFYIEEDSRCMGIRVEKVAHGLAVGMRADVSGNMKTNVNRERYILATSAVQSAEPVATGSVTPIGMNNSLLGGGAWEVVGTGGQQGVAETIGLNNIGLLVTAWGRYEQVDATTFTLDDGSAVLVRCTVPPGTSLDSGGEHVIVTGISSMYRFNSVIYLPHLLVRDIQVPEPLEAVSVPGTPEGSINTLTYASETYSTTGSTCNHGHPVEYSFDWGDGSSSPWSDSTSASHSWSAAGLFMITVTARCQVNPSVAATSASLPVNVVSNVIYVDSGSPNNGPGNDWEHAFHTVQAGLNAASSGKEVWVAAGTYFEYITLKSGVALYGGFSGTETQRNQRNWSANIAVLDGSAGQGAGVVIAPSGADSSTIIDGFTVRNGTPSGGGVASGSAIWCDSSPTITNNVIRDSSYGVYCHYSDSPTITSNVIVGNICGIYPDMGSQAKIANNTITGNEDGMGIYHASPTVANNIVAFNSGKGINNYAPGPTLRNNNIYGNAQYNYYNISPGTGDISVDPLFVNQSGSDYHLTPASPCIDAGWNDAPGLPATDLDGLPRIMGANVDIGAYEYQIGNYTGDMIYIPAGDFLMGNNGAEHYSYPNELPQHSVSLSGYYIGKYEVTREEYSTFMSAGGYSNQAYWSVDGWSWKVANSRTEPGATHGYWAANQDWGTASGGSPQPFTQTDNHPVVGVSYYEAEAFCNWAGGHLPTEAQWEKAARWTGTHANVYPWGDTWDDQKCNNWLDSLYPSYQTAPVGSYPSGASPYGCQDMAGNMREWCKDWYGSTYYSISPSSEPQGPASGNYRVLRGGSWDYGGNQCRCAYRNSRDPFRDHSNFGFRIARTAVGPPPAEIVSVPGTPTGNTTPVIDVSNEYSTTGSTCTLGHPVEYSFDWGDGTTSPWSDSTSASHSWSSIGSVSVTVTARCRVSNSVVATSTGLPVDVFESPYTGEMIYIPAGDFLMGNSGIGHDATYLNASELPQHSVTLPDYYIGKYEVTRGEYQAFMDAGGYSYRAYWSSDGWSWRVANNVTQPEYWAPESWGFTQTDNHPVVGVTYYEAEAFCAWAGGHLPTEAQWEKAARWTGSHPNVYPWGDTWDVEKYNNWGDHNVAGGGYAVGRTAPVGSYPSGVSPYGCLDMAGNVWEWVQDWYVSYPGSTSPFDYTNIYRVFRGGAYSDGFGWWGDSRCAMRYPPPNIHPYEDGTSVGFRFARPGE